MRRIPFDALVLAGVAREIQAATGSKVQQIRQPRPDTIVLELYGKGAACQLLICTHADHYRVHFLSKKPGSPPSPPPFCQAARAGLMNAVLERVTVKSHDRILVLQFGLLQGHALLIAELMGKHSNLILVDASGQIAGAMKWVGPKRSARPILPKRPYVWPPVLRSAPDLTEFDRVPKLPMSRIAEPAPGSAWDPGIAQGFGAYPVPLDLPTWLPKPTLSLALEAHYAALEQADELNRTRQSLLGQLRRVLLARETAAQDLQAAIDRGARAPEFQRQAELILAYGAHLSDGHDKLEAFDYDGNRVTIRLDPALDGKANAQRLFDKAKKAKSRLSLVKDQHTRMVEEANRVHDAIERVTATRQLRELLELKEEIDDKRWLMVQRAVDSRGAPEKVYDGFRIKELLAPGGFPVLYGENATSNDYLSTRLAKGNDLWLHVRGQTSAHVVIRTFGKPDRVQRETLMFAAKIAVQNSNQKHSGYVAVDYTLAKYVRKHRGAPAGTVFYTREKTIHVEG